MRIHFESSNSKINNTLHYFSKHQTPTMTKSIIQTAVLMLATLAIANAVIIAIGRRRREATAQNLPMDCELEFNVPKRNDSHQVDFIVCVKNDGVCTSRFVESCSDKRNDCDGFKPQTVDDEFHKLYKDAYAQVCEERCTGENYEGNCLYTDVVFEECSAAKVQNVDEICLTLTNGDVECAEIPEGKLQQLSMMSDMQQIEHLLHAKKENKKLQQFVNKKN